MTFYGSFNFLVEIEGLAGDVATVVGGFSQVSGLSTESEVIEHWVGSTSFATKVPGRTRFGNIVLRKGLTTSSDLYEWRRRIESGVDDRRSGSVILLDGGMREKARWNFYEAWPCRYEAPTFDATDNAVSVETLELAVERLERVASDGESGAEMVAAGGDAGRAARATEFGASLGSTAGGSAAGAAPASGQDEVEAD